MFDYTNTKYNSFVKEQCAKLCTTIAGIFPNEHFYLLMKPQRVGAKICLLIIAQ